MRKNNKNKGFTLVELLIVVAIIGILAAVLTPQFLNARKVAADKAVEAYGHNVYTAVQALIAEKGDIEFLESDGDYSNKCIGTDDSAWTLEGYTLPHSPNVKTCTINKDGSGVKLTVSGGTDKYTDETPLVIGEKEETDGQG